MGTPFTSTMAPGGRADRQSMSSLRRRSQRSAATAATAPPTAAIALRMEPPIRDAGDPKFILGQSSATGLSVAETRLNYGYNGKYNPSTYDSAEAIMVQSNAHRARPLRGTPSLPERRTRRDSRGLPQARADVPPGRQP